MGTYTLRASYIGYESQYVQVTVSVHDTATVAIGLKPSAVQFDQIVVTANRQPENLARAVSSVSVVEERNIRDRQALRLNESLESVPGVNVMGDFVNIRGGSGVNRLGGSRVLVLLDDVPLLTSDLGMMNWDILPITAVERIEVLKGAASSQYGAGALSGAINIISKNTTQDRSLSFRQIVGVYDDPSVPEWKWADSPRNFYRTDLSWSDSYGPVGLRLAISRFNSTSDRRNGYWDKWYASGKLTVQPFADATLTLFGTFSHIKQGLFLQWVEQNRALDLAEPDRNNHYNLNGFIGYAVYQQLFSPVLSMRIRASYNHQLVGAPVNITDALTPALGFGAEAMMLWKASKQHQLSLGLDYKLDDVGSIYYGNHRGISLAPYVQEIWKISSLLQINAGLRLDTYTLVNDSTEWQLSPKLGASYQPWFGTIVHGSWGRGFRAATVFERFANVQARDFRGIPNPDLQPERSTLIDFGIRQKFGRAFSLEVSVFSSTYDNLIEATLDPSLTVQFQNKPNARIRGIEAEVRWRLLADHLTLQANSTWMDPRELSEDEPLPYRPRYLGYFSARFDWKAWTLSGEYRYVSSYEKVTLYPLDERVPQKTLDLRLAYRIGQVTLKAVVNNALNYNYIVVERVLGEIRNFQLSFALDI